MVEPHPDDETTRLSSTYSDDWGQRKNGVMTAPCLFLIPAMAVDGMHFSRKDGLPISREGAHLVILNRQPTELDPLSDLVLHLEIGPTLGAAAGVD